MENKYSAPAAKKVLDILELMAQHPRNFTVTELSSLLEISTNSVFRILKELESKQYVVKNSSDSAYGLTAKLYYLGNHAKTRVSLIANAQPMLDRLQDETQETILLAKLDEDCQTLILDLKESSHHIKFLSSVGHAYDSYTSAMGKCLLAFSSPEKVERYLSKTQLLAVTPSTITTKAQLLEEFETIRQTKIAYDFQESIVGLTCMACPIFSANQVLEGSIGISGISFRMTSAKMQQYAELLQQESKRLSAQLLGSDDNN